MLAARAGRFARRRRRAVELLEGEAEALPFEDASFDALTFTYLLRYVDDPPATVAELARVVRPGGRSPRSSSACRRARRRALAWRLYTAVGAARCSDGWPRGVGRVGRFLGPSIRGFYARHPLERIVGYWERGRARARCACAG